ncbi:MAG: TetR/AcrR family transcriptional regulator [Candidatus Binataceae bacterium]
MAEALRSVPHDDALVKQRRRQIFLAACRVLERKSFHEASVKEFALEAGIAAGSIYVYLQGKDEILLLIGESMVAELIDALPIIRERGGDDPRRELIAMMRTILDVIDRYREAFNVLHHEGRYLARRPRYRPTMSAVSDRYFKAVGAVLERGRAAGVIQFEHLNSAVHIIHMLCAGWATGGRALAGIDKETYWREIAGIIEGRFFSASSPQQAGKLPAPELRPTEES